MISVLQAVVLGLIQGVTEWLPVSSSGHLVLAQKVFGLSAPILFDLLLHVATLLVILFVFRTDIIDIIRAFYKFDHKSKEFKTGLFIILANIPILLIGYFLQSYVEQAFSSVFVVGLGLLFTGTLLFFSDRRKSEQMLDSRSSLIIGIFQGLAVFPGVSRSGATISAARIQGIPQADAARFSFLMVIPAFVGAAFLKFRGASLEIFNISYLAGFLVAIIVSYFALNWLLKIVKEKKLHYFSYYCWLLGLVVLILF
ncbi:MAG: undecaprenyl-diphosphate phosphatase [archaeon]